jgi:hypothetical protein
MFVASHGTQKAFMETATIIVLDLAKPSFQAHGAQADGSVAFRKKLTREKVARSRRMIASRKIAAVLHVDAPPLLCHARGWRGPTNRCRLSNDSKLESPTSDPGWKRRAFA